MSELVHIFRVIQGLGRTLGDDYYAYLRSPEWQAKRQQVLARAKGKCEKCNRQAARLEVHHLHYRNFGHEDLMDLRALCEWCHLVEDRRRQQEKHADQLKEQRIRETKR